MDQVSKHTFVLINAGGGGTRLWPMSREDNPKQFAKLFSGRSLFEITVDRALKITPPDRIFITTSARYITQIRSLAKKIPHENILGEPMRRDTALAMGVGSTYIYHRDPEAIVVNMASDHLISPVQTFVSQINRAVNLATKYNLMVTIGIQPKFPHTGMGHIKAVKPFPEEKDALLGEKFVEKPPLDLAAKYTSSGHYYWNTNLFVFKAKLFLDLLQKYSPKVYTFLPKLLASLGTDTEKSVFQLTFQMSPSVAVDYAVAEKLRKFICIAAKFSWTDVGDWKEVWKNLNKDSQGNVIEGPHGKGEYVGINSRNNLLFLDKKIVATVGIQDMLIIDTPDALLICPKDDAQGVKQIVQALKDQELNKYL
jgi:mannose-1-phosphate guanylyltransferase